MPQPRAAVVIPAFGNPDDLTRVLTRVAALDHLNVQVIVAIDGPDAALASVAASFGTTVVQLPTNQGSYAARNAGIAALDPDVEIVAFTDVDCLPSPQWLTAHALTLRDAELSGGAVDVTVSAKPSPAEVVDQHRHLRQESYVLEEGYAATANLAVRRPVLKQLQFDPKLRSGGDNDFGRRARALGLRLAYSPDAVVQHPARTSAASVKRKVARIITGIESNPGRWMTRPVPPPPLRPGWLRTAAKGHGPIWLLRAYWLQQSLDWRIHRAVTRIRDEQFSAVDGVVAVVERYPEQAVDAAAVVAIEQASGDGHGIPAHFLSVHRGRRSDVAEAAHQLRKAKVTGIVTDGSDSAQPVAKALARLLRVHLQ